MSTKEDEPDLVAMAMRMHDVQYQRANRLQERIDRVIAFRNDALDTSQSPWLGKEIVSALDEALAWEPTRGAEMSTEKTEDASTDFVECFSCKRVDIDWASTMVETADEGTYWEQVWLYCRDCAPAVAVPAAEHDEKRRRRFEQTHGGGR